MKISLINIRQNSLYASFMDSIGWKVEKINGVYAYIKKLPLLPAVIKIQRPLKLPSLEKLRQVKEKYRATSIVVEPSPNLYNSEFLILNSKFSNDPYIHTKTIEIDLTSSKKVIFNRFTPAKRRAVRRAQKLGVTVEISENIDAFIQIKNRTAGLFLGFLTTRGITKPLWKTFAPEHARVLLAKKHANYFAGILLLCIDGVAYYWMAAATTPAKKMFAPTLLVWEALKFAKNQGYKVFDFEGVYDERYPKLGRSWKGFSRFKEGFGGKAVYYPQPFFIR